MPRRHDISKSELVGIRTLARSRTFAAPSRLHEENFAITDGTSSMVVVASLSQLVSNTKTVPSPLLLQVTICFPTANRQDPFSPGHLRSCATIGTRKHGTYFSASFHGGYGMTMLLFLNKCLLVKGQKRPSSYRLWALSKENCVLAATTTTRHAAGESSTTNVVVLTTSRTKVHSSTHSESLSGQPISLLIFCSPESRRNIAWYVV